MQQSPAAQRFSDSRALPRHVSIYGPFIATLKPPFKLARHHPAHKPANGGGVELVWMGAALGRAGQKQ
jgi:hypothetical protein